MKRSILKLSERTHAITLPNEWLRKNNVGKGSFIEMNENNNTLIISSDNPREIEINVEKCNTSSIIKSIVSSYHLGYDSLKLVYSERAFDVKDNTERESLEVIKDTCNQLIGFEIVNQGKGYCVIKDVTMFNGEEFKNILRRMFLLLNEFGRETFYNIQENREEDLLGKHTCLRKFYNYCKRYLNKHGKAEKTLAYNDLINHLMGISNSLRMISKEKRKYSKEMMRMFNESLVLLEEGYTNFYDFDVERSSEILARRRKILDSFKMATVDDAVLSQRVAVILNSVFGIVDCAMEIGFREKVKNEGVLS